MKRFELESWASSPPSSIMPVAFPELPSYPSHFSESPSRVPYDPRGLPPPFTTIAARQERPADGARRPSPWPPLTVGNILLYEPLVKTGDVKDHLRLLGAFHRLRRAVLQAHDIAGPIGNISPSERYQVFLDHSVWRFMGWIHHFVRTGVKVRMPWPVANEALTSF